MQKFPKPVKNKRSLQLDIVEAMLSYLKIFPEKSEQILISRWHKLWMKMSP